MNTVNCAACRKKIAKEKEKEFLKEQYAIYKALVKTFACFSTAAVLMAHIRRGRSKKYIQDLFEDLVMIYDTPALFGKEIRLPDMMKRLEKEYDIDFKRINVHYETESEFIKGGKK